MTEATEATKETRMTKAMKRKHLERVKIESDQNLDKFNVADITTDLIRSYFVLLLRALERALKAAERSAADTRSLL